MRRDCTAGLYTFRGHGTDASARYRDWGPYWHGLERRLLLDVERASRRTVRHEVAPVCGGENPAKLVGGGCRIALLLHAGN
jgi:hypothetical protein